MNPDTRRPQTPEELQEALARLAAEADKELGLEPPQEEEPPATAADSVPEEDATDNTPEDNAAVSEPSRGRTTDSGGKQEARGSDDSRTRSASPEFERLKTAHEAVKAKEEEERNDVREREERRPPSQYRGPTMRVNLGGKKPKHSLSDWFSGFKKRKEERPSASEAPPVIPPEPIPGRPEAENEFAVSESDISSPEVEGAKEAFDAAREKYIKEYRIYHSRQMGRMARLRRSIFGYKENEDDLPDELIDAKADYNRAKQAYGAALFETKKSDLQNTLSGREANAGIGEYRMEIFRRFIVEERGNLQKLQVDSWPPRERGLFGKFLANWNNIPIPVRLAISAGLATGGFALAGILPGGFALYSAGTFFGGRYLTGALSLGSGATAGEGIRKLLSWDSGRRKETSLKRLENTFSMEAITDADDEYRKILEDYASAEGRKALITAMGAVATGAGAGMLANIYFGGTRLSQKSGRQIPGERVSSAQGERGTAEPSRGKATEPAPREANQTRETVQEEVKRGASQGNDPSPAQAEPSPKAVQDQTPPKTPVRDVAPPQEASPSEDITVVKKGGSVWKSVHDQLEHRFRADPEKFGLSQDDINDPKKFGRILNRNTANILTEQGFMNGEEIRISRPGVRVILNEDNTVAIEGDTYKVPRGTYETIRKSPELPERESASVQPEGSETPRSILPNNSFEPELPHVDFKDAPFSPGSTEPNVPSASGSRDVSPGHDLSSRQAGIVNRILDKKSIKFDDQMKQLAQLFDQKKVKLLNLLVYLFTKGQELNDLPARLSGEELSEAEDVFESGFKKIVSGDVDLEQEGLNSLKKFLREHTNFWYKSI